MKNIAKQMLKNLLSMIGVFVIKIPGSGIYAESGMATIHNAEALKMEKFQAAYKRGVKAADVDYGIQWRAYVACWAASQAICAGKGDFVECGVNRGFMSSAIMTYLDWNRLDRKFYLVDTFKGIHEDIVSDEEKKAGYIEKSRKAIARGDYTDDVERVRKNFKEWTQAHIVQGFVPEILKNIPKAPVAFVHLDMNNVTPEKAAAEYFWPIMIKGGVMLMDDYAFIGYDLSKKGMDEFARSVGAEILSMPTGQGILIKT
ncbi:MAG: TylF/MycF/NovP-related O-methyltransferase [Candidatus Omnitrophota bacterium]